MKDLWKTDWRMGDGGRENKEKMKLEKRREKFCIKNEKNNFVSATMKILRDRQMAKSLPGDLVT